jgi:hypothetical protein
MLAMIPVLFAIAGLLLYGLAPGKASALGLWIFVCAFHVLMLRTGGEHVRLF